MLTHCGLGFCRCCADPAGWNFPPAAKISSSKPSWKCTAAGRGSFPRSMASLRTNKPPLPAWICAAFVPSSTTAKLSHVNERDAAYRQLSWEVRWPALLFSCLTIVACGWMGRILISDGIGIASAAIASSCLLFLRFSRSMTTDVHLMLWVTSPISFSRSRFFAGAAGQAQ